MNLIGGLFLSVLMQFTSITVNQEFFNLYSGGPQKFGGHYFYSNCQFTDVLMKR